jgi:hypothetical protein
MGIWARLCSNCHRIGVAWSLPSLSNAIRSFEMCAAARAREDAPFAGRFSAAVGRAVQQRQRMRLAPMPFLQPAIRRRWACASVRLPQRQRVYVLERHSLWGHGPRQPAPGRAAVCICAHFHRPDSRRNRSVRLEKITEPLLGSRHDAHHADARPPCPLLDFRKRCLLCLRASSSSPLGATISAQIGGFVPRHSTG